MFRIVLILSADKDDIHFLRHLLKYLHKQAVAELGQTQVLVEVEAEAELGNKTLNKYKELSKTRLNCFNVKTN